MKTVMILGASASEVPVIQRAIDMGNRVVVVDYDKNAPGFKERGVIRENFSIADKNKILEFAKKYNIDGILSSVDAGVRPTAYVSNILGLPGISEEAAYMGTNKAAMRKRLQERCIPIPKFFIIKTMKEYLEAVSQFEKKCIVKAVDSSGSRGIYLLKNLKANDDVDYAYGYCMEYSGTGELIVEEYMEGPEICVETLSSGGICYPIQITDQMPKLPPYFTDCGYSQPSLLPKNVIEEIKQIAINANMAVENYQGSSCTEMIVTKDGPKVVELGVRLAGDFMTTKMVPLSLGVDMPGAVVKIALGEPINIIPTLKKASCVKYFMKERIGVIKDVVGLDEALKVKGVQEVGIHKEIGEIATILRKSSDRLGYVITQMDTVEEAIESADKALSKIDFIV